MFLWNKDPIKLNESEFNNPTQTNCNTPIISNVWFNCLEK